MIFDDFQCFCSLTGLGIESILAPQLTSFQHKSGKKAIRAEYFELWVASLHRPFLNIVFVWFLLIAFWFTFGAFGSILLFRGSILAAFGTFWYRFCSTLIH